MKRDSVTIDQKHQKYDFCFLEVPLPQQQQQQQQQTTNNNSNIVVVDFGEPPSVSPRANSQQQQQNRDPSSDDADYLRVSSFVLPKPYHEDASAPLLQLSMEQSCDDNTSTIANSSTLSTTTAAASSSSSFTANNTHNDNENGGGPSSAVKPLLASIQSSIRARSESVISLNNTNNNQNNNNNNANNNINDKLKFANSANVSIRNLEPFAQQCLHLFNGQFTVMQNMDLFVNPPNSTSSDKTNQNTDSTTSAPTSILPPSIEALFNDRNVFPPFKSVKQPFSTAHNNHPSTFSTQQHLLLKCLALRFQSKFTEPLFCSLELVDVKHKKRISERIWFHRNSFGMVNDFYEDLDMKRKVKDHGVSGGNGIFSVTNQHLRPNDIYVVMWVWRTLNAQARDQVYGKSSLLGKKNGTVMSLNSTNGALMMDDHSSMDSIETATMPTDNVGLKSHMTPFCVSFAPLIHRGNTPSMGTNSSSGGQLKNPKHPYGHDGFLIAMTHFFPPCSYHELYTNLIPNIQSQCSVSVTALPSHVTQLDILLHGHMENQSKNISKKYKGIPGWFMFQVQSFDAHLYENDLLYRAYMLYLDSNLTQRLSYGGSVQLQDAMYEIQQFNDNKLPVLQQQCKELEEQEHEALRRLQEREATMANRRKSLINVSDLNSKHSNTSTLTLIGGILNSSNQHLRKEPKSYLPLMVQELLPSGVAPSSPFFTFVHNLYIYPFSVDLTRLRLEDKTKLKPRNILLEITTREENGTTLPRIYPPHYSQHSSSLQLQTSYFCSVTYDDKKPSFIDEVKLALPLPIKSDDQRVVFNFYHLVIEKGLKRRKTLNERGDVPKILLATCEFSLLDIVSRQEQSQNIIMPLLKPNPIGNKPNTYDPRVNVFKFTTQLESTIYPREQSLNSFFKDCSPFLNVVDRQLTPNVDMRFISDALKKAMSAIRTLMKLPFNRIVSHYTLIIDMLVSMMSRTPDVLKNFVENIDMSAEKTFAKPPPNNMNIDLGISMDNVSQQRGKIRQSISATNYRGSVRADQVVSNSPNFLSALEKNEDQRRSRNSIATRRSRNSDSIDQQVNAAKPGDSDFDLKAYLAAQTQSNTTTASPNAKRQSRLFTALSNAVDNKNKRFSLFNLGNQKKGDDPFSPTDPTFFQGLEDLAERREKRGLSQTENTLSDDISDFLSVSTSLFELQTLAFQALVSLLKSACYAEDTSGRGNRLLSSYVQYIFKDVIMTTSPFCFILCEVWTNVLSASDSSITVSAYFDETPDIKDQSSDSQNILRAIKRKSLANLDASDRAKSGAFESVSNSRYSSASSYRGVMGIMANESPLFYESLQVCWFWFEMILKSFLITVQSEMKQGDSFYGTTKPTTYSAQAEKLYTLLRDLFKTLAEKAVQYKDDANVMIAQTINTQVGFMVRGLISSGMFPVEYALLLMDTYLASLDEFSTKRSRGDSIKRRFLETAPEPSSVVSVSTLKLKIALFRVVSDHTHFLALNNSTYHPKEYVRETCSCPPVKLLSICTEAVINSHFSDSDVQTLLCEAIQYVFSRYEQSTELPREQRPLELQLIGRVFFPYVYVLCNKYEILLANQKQPALKEHLQFALFVLSKLNNDDILTLLLERKGANELKQNSGVTRHQFITFLTLVLSSFGSSSSDGEKTPSDSHIDSRSTKMIDMSYDLFLRLAEDSGSWLNDCYAYGPPSITNFTQFGLESSSNEPFLAFVIFYIAKLLQRMSEIPALREKLVGKLDGLYAIIRKLTESRLVSSNCYWKWLYACSISNYQFIVRNFSDDEQEQTSDVKFNLFLEKVVLLLHTVYPDITAIDQLPAIVEDFVDPLGLSGTTNSTLTRPSNATASCDEVSELSSSIQTTYALASSSYSPSTTQPIEVTDDSSTDNPQNTAVLEYDEQTYIKSGTLEQLVWRLVNQKPNSSGKEEDRKYNEIFFLTYRSFATPAQVLNYIIAEFRHISLDPNRWHEFTVIRLLNSIKHWMSNHPYDFTPSLFASMFIFLQRDVVDFASNIIVLPVTPNMGTNPKTVATYLGLAKRLRDSVVSLLLADSDSKDDYTFAVEYFFSQKTPPSILPSSYINRTDAEAVESNSKIPITDWSPIETARQMTLIEYGIFSRIKPRECFKLGWSKPDKHTRSPHIVKLVDQLNKVSSWIATCIIREDTPKKRGLIIKYWILVAKECRQLNNFDGIFTIMGALNNSSVRRLKKSWETISQKKMKILTELEDLVSVSGNSKAMRNAILISDPPCVPYVGLFLTDLTFIEEGNNDLTKNNLINYSKRRKIAKVIANIRMLQQKPYQINIVPELRQKFLVCDDIMDESALYKQSLIVEPREPQQ